MLILEDLRGAVTLHLDKPTPQDEVQIVTLKALREQAHIELVELPNHVLYFRPLSSTGEVATSSSTISKGGLPQLFPGTAVARPDMNNSYVKEWRSADYPEPIECILNHVELVTGRKISADPAVLALSGPEHGMFLFKVTFRDVSFEMAQRLYRSGLKEKLGVILDDLPDGSFHARLDAKPASPGDAPKPNS